MHAPVRAPKRVDLDLDRIWLYLMELPAAKTVPPLLSLRDMNILLIIIHVIIANNS